MVKYIFITGNLLEYNKSIIIASLGALLKEHNLKIDIKKISNFKPELTYVTNDGSEVDLDLGYYERIAEIITSSNNNIIISQIYKDIENKIINFIELDSKYYDIILIDSINIYVNIINHFLKDAINIHILSNHNLVDYNIQPNIIINKYDFIKFMHPNIYKIPYFLSMLNFDKKVLKLLHIQPNYHTTKWKQLYNNLSNLNECIIYVYVIIKFTDSYIPIIESLKHAAYSLNKDIKIIWINPENFNIQQMIHKIKEKKGGILVPGGYGKKGFENKIEIIKFARENNIPFLGICYGMQLMIIEYARNVLKINNATTEEVDAENKYIHIFILNNFKIKRIGSHIIKIKINTISYNIYNSLLCIERHRHKYKFNTEFINKFERKGLFFTGSSLNDEYIEIIEVPKNNFYIGVQFHPELNSTIFKPNPIIVSFIKEIIKF